MTVRFDPESPRLRLDPRAVGALHAWIRDPDAAAAADPGGVGELYEHRVLRDGAPHPRLAPGFDAIRAPVCRLRLRDRYPQEEQWRARDTDGWVGRRSATLLVDRPDGLQELAVVPVMLLPAAIARAVGFGPRPRHAGPPLRVATDLLDGVVSPDRDRRADAVTRFPDAVTLAPTLGAAAGDPRTVATALLAGLRGYWEAVMSWDPADGAVGRRECRVIDTDTGMWLVEPTGGHATLRPVSPTALWRAVIQLLPSAREHRAV